MSKKKKIKNSEFSTKKIKKFSAMFEAKDRHDDGGLFGMLWDAGNKKAMQHHAGITKKYEDKEYTISIDKPSVMKINDFDDFYKIKILFRKYGISFTEKEESKKTIITDN